MPQNRSPNPDAPILLLQVRERVDVEQQEQACFVEQCGVAENDLDAVNLVRDPSPDMKRIESARAVIIGGAGIYSATKDYPFTSALADIILRLRDRGTPLFGACFGHQIIARTLGGSVVTDRSRAEIGTHEVTLTAEGTTDPLLASLPERFPANMGHNDHVTRLPDGGVELALSPNSRNQIFRIDNKPIYGAQFHCELTYERLIERLAIYQDLYMPEDDEFEKLTENPTPTPEAVSILRRFVQMFVLD